MAVMPKSAVALIAAAAVASTGCSTHREFRVSAVGSDGSFEIASDEDSSGAPGAHSSRGSSAVVSSGNLLLGGTGTSGVLGGTVIGTLGSTEQTVVQLASGTTVLLDGVGGTLGDAVSIDLGAGRVVGGPGSLVGVGVLGTSAGGSVAAGSTGTGSVVQLGGSTSASGTVSAGTGSAGALLPRTSGTGSVTKTVTGTATGTLTGALGKPCC